MTQPNALRLADALDANATNGDMGRKPDPRCHKRQAAAELRRLHEVNQELLEALKDATEGLEIASAGGGVDFYAYAKTSRAAINKVEGEVK